MLPISKSSSRRILLTVFTLIVTVNCALNCPQLLTKADKCMSRAVLIGVQNFTIPTHVDQLEDTQCRRIRIDVKCLSAYRVCLKDFPRMFYGLVVRNIKNHIVKYLCGTSKGKAEFTQNLACFHEGRLRQLYPILNQLTAILDYVRMSIPEDHMIGGLCCGYRFVIDFGQSKVDELCEGHVPKGVGKFIAHLMHNMVGDAVDLVCGQHSSMDICHEKLPFEMSQFKNITSRAAPDTSYSPLIPILEIAHKLGSKHSF